MIVIFLVKVRTSFGFWNTSPVFTVHNIHNIHTTVDIKVKGIISLKSIKCT